MAFYTEDRLAGLLPAVWDASQAMRDLNKETGKIDPNMPKGPARDPRLAMDRVAEVADAGRAFRLALTPRQQQAVFCIHVLRETDETAAKLLGVAHQTVSRNRLKGMARMVAFLNGKEVDDGEEGDE